MARILLVEPFYGGSHKAFADGLVRHSRHDFELITLPAGEWRRRMRRSAQELAPVATRTSGHFDVLMVTDMLDLPAFLALTRPQFAQTPILCYFHENQLTYPRLRGTNFNSWFGQVNYLSAAAADFVAFNSAFHRDDFVGALRSLEQTPNGWLSGALIDAIAAKSTVLPVGVELAWLDDQRVASKAGLAPLILWNHRWEFDKDPAVFARVISGLADRGVAFRLALAGDEGPNPAPELVRLVEQLGERVVHAGFVATPEAYARLLWESDLVVSTARHEFFGVGMVEALYCGCVPVAPRGYNYPALAPPAWHEQCLFEDEPGLSRRLTSLLSRPLGMDEAGRTSASRFSWPAVIREWDETLEMVSRRESPPGGMHDSTCVRP